MKFQMAQLWKEHDQKVRPYIWAHRALGLLSSIVGIVWGAFLLASGQGKLLEVWAAEHTAFPLAAWWLYFFLVVGAYKVLLLPVSVGHFWVEHHFELSKQKFSSWIADQLKGILLGGILGGLALTVGFYCVHYVGKFWWVALAAFLIFFSVVLAQLAPVVLIPLFFKMAPLEESPLKTRLMALCERFKIEVKEIYHLGLGAKTEKGNAAFVGLGRTKRIILGDTLYQKFDPLEVEAVFAHELGHQVHHDLVKGLVMGALFLFLSFYVAGVLGLPPVLNYLDVSWETPFAFLLFIVLLSVVQIPVNWIQTFYSRQREWAADSFASIKTGLAIPLANALEKLTLQNWGQFSPNPLIEFFTFSHPSPSRRIHQLREGQSPK